MKIHFKKLNHIQICVPRAREAEARDFYLEKLGLQEIEKPEDLKPNGGFWAALADIQLHIGVEDQIHPSKRHPALEVEALDAVKAYMLSLGLRIKEDKPVPGFKRFSFYDPFGNRIELMESIG